MAGHQLIAAQLHVLAARLPAQAVDELADGLAESYERQLERCGDPDAAARAAVAEFGDADTVTAAFFRDSPWRRAAMLLLATGPLMAAAWGTALVAGQAWTWPVPTWAKLLYGTALAAIVVALILVVRERRAYRRTRALTAAGALALLVLDGLMLVAVVLAGTGPVWPMAIAVPASLVRILATVRGLPAVLSAG